jgi:hypothetical protein
VLDSIDGHGGDELYFWYDSTNLHALLDELSQELEARGARAELFLVGGAALAVAYDTTR